MAPTHQSRGGSSFLNRFSWVLYGDKQFTGEVCVLSEGHYPSLTSMGCPPDFTARSIKVVPMVREAAAPPCDYKHCHLRPLTFIFFSFRPASRFQSRPSPCSAWSAWRAERSPRRRRSSAWWRRASTTTFCRSESTEAGECVCVSLQESVCTAQHHQLAFWFPTHCKF